MYDIVVGRVCSYAMSIGLYTYIAMNVEGKHSAIFNECNLIQPDVRSGSELARYRGWI